MRSDQIKKGLKQAPARAMLRAVGVGDEDFGRPFVGVVNTFTDVVARLAPAHLLR